MHSQIWTAFAVGAVIGAAVATCFWAWLLERNSRRSGG